MFSLRHKKNCLCKCSNCFLGVRARKCIGPSNEGAQHMFSSRNKKKLSLNYLQYPLLSGALISSVTGLLYNRIMAPNIQEYLSLKKELFPRKHQELILIEKGDKSDKVTSPESVSIHLNVIIWEQLLLLPCDMTNMLLEWQKKRKNKKMKFRFSQY